MRLVIVQVLLTELIVAAAANRQVDTGDLASKVGELAFHAAGSKAFGLGPNEWSTTPNGAELKNVAAQMVNNAPR